ncbi:hypothetical protein PENTCL1PPCAC_8932, partial [Pristionchus entomophagus]
IGMRLILLLTAAGAVSALPPRNVRRANFDALPADTTDDKLDLVFASALWRHGDRAAEHAVPGCDQFPEDAWTFGGGGYGELSPEGMKMHFDLGRKIRKRYIDDQKFLSSAYNAKEIYIRSTDYNRTLVSAYSNVAGMYSGFGIEGQNFPTKEGANSVPEWPAGYIPIPVHTVDYGTDYVGHPDAKCPRQEQLYGLVKQSPEYQSYINDPQVAQILKYLSDETSTKVTIDNIYDLDDPLFCQSIHIEELNQTDANIADFYPWYYTGDIPAWAAWIIDQDEQFTDGTGNPGGVNGIDVSVEIPKIRAGDTLKLLVSNVDGVLKCRDNMDADACSNFYKKLRYYALSAHDTTLAAFLTILGVKKYIIPEGYPNYSAAILIEVFENRDTKDRFFKVLYHADKNDDFKPITAFVRGCDFKENLCPIAVLDDLVKKYAPDTDMATLCNTPVDGTAFATTAQLVTGSTTSDVPVTTPKTTIPTTHQDTTTSSVSSISLLSALSVMISSFLL